MFLDMARKTRMHKVQNKKTQPPPPPPPPPPTKKKKPTNPNFGSMSFFSVFSPSLRVEAYARSFCNIEGTEVGI